MEMVSGAIDGTYIYVSVIDSDNQGTEQEKEILQSMY